MFRHVPEICYNVVGARFSASRLSDKTQTVN
jgi:hypothetical protein